MKGEFSGAGSLLQAQAGFRALLHFIQKDSQSEEISQVEKQPLSKLLSGSEFAGGVCGSERHWLCGPDLGAGRWESVGVSGDSLKGVSFGVWSDSSQAKGLL